MAAPQEDKVDYRLLNGVCNLVICSACLRKGRVTPVPQIIASRRTPTNLCAKCRLSQSPGGKARGPGKLLHFPA